LCILIFDFHQNFKSLGADVHLETAFIENKNRYIDKKSGQQVLRFDEHVADVSFNISDLPCLSDYDCIVFSDYDCKVVYCNNISEIK
jgi:hypothetical protein